MVNSMKKSFIESQKKMLLAKRQEIMDTLKGRNEQLSNLVEAAEPGDEADIASDRIDGNLALKLGDEDMRRLEQINSALERITKGTYGVCQNCGDDISEGRLEAMPYAMLCLNCQAAEERRNR